MSWVNWLSLLGLTFATFIFNTSEFIPIGLLTDIKNDFGLTEATVGMLISVYAWAVMILSLPFVFEERLPVRFCPLTSNVSLSNESQ